MEFIRERCENYEAFRECLEAYTLDRVEEITGVPKQTVAEAARLYATSGPTAILYTMGITQHTHGTDNVQAVANLAMLTGNLGQTGYRRQPAARPEQRAGRLRYGRIAQTSTPGYQSVTDSNARNKFEAAWGSAPGLEAGLTLSDMIPAAYEGKGKSHVPHGRKSVAQRSGRHARP